MKNDLATSVILAVWDFSSSSMFLGRAWLDQSPDAERKYRQLNISIMSQCIFYYRSYPGWKLTNRIFFLLNSIRREVYVQVSAHDAGWFLLSKKLVSTQKFWLKLEQHLRQKSFLKSWFSPFLLLTMMDIYIGISTTHARSSM